ncbi:hypothetical protein [Lentzea sp.]|uniref:hypothetical protein n=1 Tax=Lentzea sp. TaxID=56099 RepID=UPI002CDEB420|nr:hypothetical protein [Lentzea sp.]HUQ58383.1 hypothetical protein [Lentzea sp.]
MRDLVARDKEVHAAVRAAHLRQGAIEPHRHTIEEALDGERADLLRTYLRHGSDARPSRMDIRRVISTVMAVTIVGAT